MQIKLLRTLGLFTTVLMVCAPAHADVELRVEAWPKGDPVKAHVRVSEGRDSVSGLATGDFTVMLDGQSLREFSLASPPRLDPTQRKSIVFVVTDPTGVGGFISQMEVGDYAAIVTFREDGGSARYARTDTQPFTQIDEGTGAGILTSFLEHIYRRDAEDFRPEIIPLDDAINQALAQFTAPAVPLPEGPKAIIVTKPGLVFYKLLQQSDIVAKANSLGIPIFAIHSGQWGPWQSTRFTSIAEATGGIGYPVSGGSETSRAFVSLATFLDDAYRLEIPPSAFNDCNPHVLEVSAKGQTASITVTPCDTTPDDLIFPSKLDVPIDTIVVSDPVAITGIETVTVVEVIEGEYSIGCGQSFSSSPGHVLPGDEICVRHTSGKFTNQQTSTVIVVGGVPSTFSLTTNSPPPPTPPPPPSPPSPPPQPPLQPADGGGGSIGVLELFFALWALLAQRQRTASVGWSQLSRLTVALF